MREQFPDAVVLPGATALPPPSDKRWRKKVKIPTNPLAIAFRLARGVLHQLKQHDPAHHRRPQLNVATQDARWFSLCKVDGVTVTTADGRGVVYRQRDRAKMFALLRESLRQHIRLARKFNRMRKVYREALPVLSSKQKWETVLVESSPGQWLMTLRGEEAALVAVQSALADRPGVLAGARGLSHFGEHSIGWVAVAALGALLQPRRRQAWLAAGVGAFLAHAAAVVIKRVVKRERPHHPAIAVNVGTPSRLSFPSAHATSTTAASMLLARITGPALTRGVGAADGVVPLGARRALPERRAHRRRGRGGRREDGRSRRRPGWRRLMSISSESSAESAPQVNEEPAPVKGPPSNLVTGLIKAIRPRQWVKNLLVLIAPVAAFGGDVQVRLSRCRDQGADRIRRVQPGRVVGVSRQRRPRRRGRPPAPDQTLPPDRRGRRARVAGLLPGGGARHRGAGGLLAGHAEPGSGDRHLHRHAAGLLLRTETPTVLDICIVVVGVPDPGHRRWRRGGYPAVAMVPAGDDVRLAVHGGRASATPNCSWPSGPVPRSASRWRVTRPAICASSGRCRRRRRCSATGCGPSSGMATTRPGTR